MTLRYLSYLPRKQFRATKSDFATRIIRIENTVCSTSKLLEWRYGKEVETSLPVLHVLQFLRESLLHIIGVECKTAVVSIKVLWLFWFFSHASCYILSMPIIVLPETENSASLVNTRKCNISFIETKLSQI